MTLVPRKKKPVTTILAAALQSALLALYLLLAACDSERAIGTAGADVAIADPTDIVLIMGQSNAVGGANTLNLPPELAFYANPYPGAWAQELNCPADDSGGPCEYVRTWAANVRPRGHSFGVELSAIRRLDERFTNPVGLLKHATNGSSLFRDWDVTSPEILLWDYAIAFIDARMAELPAGSRIVGLLWIQGGSDGAGPAPAEDYVENLAFLIGALRQRYGCVPVVLDHLHPLLINSKPYANTVRAEQDQLPLFVDDVAVVETDDLTLRDGIAHYDPVSTVTLGLRMADALGTCP